MNAPKISARLRAAGFPVVASDARSELGGIRVTSEAGRVVVRATYRRDQNTAVLVAQDTTRELEAAGYAVTQTPGLTTLRLADPLSDELGLTRAARAAVVALLNGESVKLAGTVRAKLERLALVDADGELNRYTARSLGLRMVPSVESAFSRRPVVHRFRTSGEAYNASQTDELIANGDVLVSIEESVIGVLMQAWPIAVTATAGELHELNKPAGDVITKMIASDGSEGIAFAAGVLEAIAVARAASRHGWARHESITAFERVVSCVKCTELIEDAELIESYDTPAGLCAECAAFETEIAAGK